MLDALVGFVALLRRDGIGVGSDRTVLAARALRLVDLTDRSEARRALRLALVVHGADEGRFDELVDRWFDGAAFEAGVPEPSEVGEAPPEDPATRQR